VPRWLVVSRCMGGVVTPLGWVIEMPEGVCVAETIASCVGGELKWSALKVDGCGGMTYPKSVLLSEVFEDCLADTGDSKVGLVPKDGLVVLDLDGSVVDSGEPTAMGMSPSLSYIFMIAPMRL
jgi:hypothetical protein